MFCSFFSAEAPARYSNENSNNKKNSKRALDSGKREKAGASLPIFPFPLSPTRFLSILVPASLRHKTPLKGRECFVLTGLRPSLARVSFII